MFQEFAERAFATQ